jgi:hypothetical protein
MLAAGLETPHGLPARSAASAARQWPRLDVPNVLWFFGAFVTATTSVLVVDRVPESHRDVWELIVSLAFFTAYAVAATLLWRRFESRIPGGVMAAVAAAMVPAIGYGFTNLIGTLPEEDSSFDPFQGFSGSVFGIGVATTAVALAAFLVTRVPFLFFVVTIATQITAQLLLPALVPDPGDDAHALTAIVTGGGLVLIGLVFDAQRRRQDAFWFHVVGLFGVAAALGYFSTGFEKSSERGWIPMLAAGAVVLLAAVPLWRATWATFGAAGVGAALIHYLVRAGSWFTYVLLAIALALFAVGLVAHRSGVRRIGRRATAV